MEQDLKSHIENALMEFSKDEHYQTLVKAKETYFSKTGKVQEEDDDYESRMTLFNEWYVFHFTYGGLGDTPIRRYMARRSLPEEITECFYNVVHSVFEFTGKNLRGQMILQDLLHNKKVTLSRDTKSVPLLKGDLFLGRVLLSKKSGHLLNGLCLLPREVKSIIKKESKRIRKADDLKVEMEFLLKVEALKTKSGHYPHLDPKKIFNFGD